MRTCAIASDSAKGITTVAYFQHLLEFGLAEGIVVQTAAAGSDEPERPVVVTAPPERVDLFDIDSGERLR